MNRTDRGEDLWFLATRVVVRLSSSEGSDGISILEHHAPLNDSPPLHVHRTEDEVFHVLEGELYLHTETGSSTLRAGQIGVAQKGVVHTYRVDSAEGARWLTITACGDFERFVRAASRKAEGSGLPPALPGPPTPEQQQALAGLAASFGIELVGPPLPPAER